MHGSQSDELSARLELARRIAARAGKVTLKYYQSDFQRETKLDGTVVTIADRESEQLMRRAIEKAFPDDGILGEEYGEKPGRSRYRWILDPIDGTISFAQGVPLYGVLIGIEDQETRDCPVGLIHIPALGETVYAQRGAGCAWERPLPLPAGKKKTTPARVSSVDELERALLLATDFFRVERDDRRQALARLAAQTRVQRTWSDCYGYVLVATGRAELMLDPVMHIWDCAPLQPILTEAGGTFTDWAGNRTIYGACGLATNGRLLPQVLKVLGEAGAATAAR